MPLAQRSQRMDRNLSQSTGRRRAAIGVGRAIVIALLAVSLSAPLLVAEPDSQLDFGTDMASRGLWSEALFRFRQAEEQSPNDPRILNNIAVSLEALGLYDEALEAYRQAVETSPSLEHAKRNYARFVEFYQAYRGGEVDAEDAAGETADANGATDEESPGVGGIEEASEEPTPDDASDTDEDEV